MSAGKVGEPATKPDFPRVEARSLNGRTYRLPGDLEGENNVVIVGFERWQQELIDSWVPYLEESPSRLACLRFYELAATSRLRLPAWGIIDGGMVAGIPDRNVRARNARHLHGPPQVSHLPRFLTSPGFSLASISTVRRTIAAFLTEPAGRILWRATGIHDYARQADPESALGLG